MGLFDLSGKAAVVTGGSSGIGFGLAKGLLEAGASVLIVARDAEKNRRAVAALSALGKVTSAEADVSKDEGGEAMANAAIHAFGRLDILVNNAGTNFGKQPQDYAIAEWHQLIDVNLKSTYVCSIAAHARMRSGGGKIVNIGSMMSLFGVSFSAPYGAAKGGVVSLTKSLASAWAKDHIQVNAILPGWIDTELTKKRRIEVPDLHDRVVARTPGDGKRRASRSHGH